jgi:hypothetical protein
LAADDGVLCAEVRQHSFPDLPIGIGHVGIHPFFSVPASGAGASTDEC